MNIISEENRREANKKVDKIKREIQVLKILKEDGELTPKQIARRMEYRGYTTEIDYNKARPRLTKLLEYREVCIVGKELDTEINCKEAVYSITEKGQRRVESYENNTENKI